MDYQSAEGRESSVLGINKTFEYHNKPPILPFKHPNPNNQQNKPPVANNPYGSGRNVPLSRRRSADALRALQNQY